jgi:hypothetical protein
MADGATAQSHNYNPNDLDGSPKGGEAAGVKAQSHNYNPNDLHGDSATASLAGAQTVVASQEEADPQEAAVAAAVATATAKDEEAARAASLNGQEPAATQDDDDDPEREEKAEVQQDLAESWAFVLGCVGTMGLVYSSRQAIVKTAKSLTRRKEYEQIHDLPEIEKDAEEFGTGTDLSDEAAVRLMEQGAETEGV